jgi:hypothetical protein
MFSYMILYKSSNIRGAANFDDDVDDDNGDEDNYDDDDNNDDGDNRDALSGGSNYYGC